VFVVGNRVFILAYNDKNSLEFLQLAEQLEMIVSG
jgi:hypothetical protein